MRRVLRNKYYVNGQNNASKSIVIWELSSDHFYRKVISEISNLWYNILEVINGMVDHRERAEHKPHIGQSDLYLKNKSNLFLW